MLSKNNNEMKNEMEIFDFSVPTILYFYLFQTLAFITVLRSYRVL